MHGHAVVRCTTIGDARARAASLNMEWTLEVCTLRGVHTPTIVIGVRIKLARSIVAPLNMKMLHDVKERDTCIKRGQGSCDAD